MSNLPNNFTERDIKEFFTDTSSLIAAEQSANLSKAANGALSIPRAQAAGTLTDKVEFWKWMGQNHPNSFTTITR
jgi:hypothetical protein